ncbi:MAG TPA: NADH-quinone oxidoreductase subunit D [Armatimonadota bacterium]
MGPQHPSTHGVLRLVLKLDGETVLKLVPVIGYLHRGMEKIAESRTYTMVIPYTDRLDYLSSMYMNLGYVRAVEQLLAVEVPERARFLRTAVVELQRIASHLIWLGSFALDLGATTVFVYTFRERELILDLFEKLCGARLTYNYIRFGGVMADCPEAWKGEVEEYLDLQEERLREYEDVLTNNPVFRGRTEGIGIISAAEAINYGLSGPSLRGSGVAFDVRKSDPYDAYGEVDFAIVTAPGGDCFARYQVRIGEIRESIKIVRQCLARMAEGGEVLAKLPKTLKPPAGEAYARVEAPRGDFGVLVVSDGTTSPARVRFRSPSFANLSALDHMCRGHKLADVVAILGSIDIVLGEVDR